MMKKIFFLLCMTFTLLAHAEKMDDEVDCNNPISTLDVNYCAFKEYQIAESDLKKYFNEAKKSQASNKKVMSLLNKSQKTWLEHREAFCSAVYEMWKDGSIRNLQLITCKTELTKQRTYTIWQSFLTYMDDSPPILPEPK